MLVEQIEKIAPGNPFLSDMFHMGTYIGTNCVVMFSKFENEEHDYIIVVNTKTGERIRISLEKNDA